MSAQSNPRRIGRTAFMAGLTVSLLLVTAYVTRAQDPAPPSGNTRQTLITNQFTTVTNGSLQLRRPGNWVGQGIAVANGSAGFFDGGEIVEEPNFFSETFDMIVLQILDMITQMIQGLNLLGGGNPLSGLTGLTGLGSDPLTGDGGGSIPIQ